MTLPLPQAPPSEVVCIGEETIAHLAEGEAVLVNGGRVLLVAASDFPRNRGGCASFRDTSAYRPQEGTMSDRSDREFAPDHPRHPQRPEPGVPDLSAFAAVRTRLADLERQLGVLEGRVAELELAAGPPVPPHAA